MNNIYSASGKIVKIPKILILIFMSFILMMVIVTFKAYSKRSGNTGLDMAKISFIRQGALKNDQQFPLNLLLPRVLVIPSGFPDTGLPSVTPFWGS